MRDAIAGQGAHDGLGIFDLAVEHGVDQLVQRHEVHVDELVIIGVGRIELELGSQVDMDNLVTEAAGRDDRRQKANATGPKARLLVQLALGAIERILARVELAGGNLDRHTVDGGAVLTHQHNLAALGQRHNGRRARMSNHIAGAAVTVGQLNLKTVDVEDLAFPGALLRKNLLV